MASTQPHAASYRDPSGYLFYHNAVLYRQVNRSGREDYERFMSSGFYTELAASKKLIPHQELGENLTGDADAWKTLQPEPLRFVSYPYEWSFNMWKDAALLTLELALDAMKHGLLLKDASAYNIQLHKGQMQLIDTLSFERYTAGLPWIAYRQFCEHFLAPLALMHYKKMPLQPLFLAYPDGIPISVAGALLPGKSRFHLNTFLHLHLHAGLSKKGKTPSGKPQDFSAQKMQNLIRSLQDTVSAYSLEGKTGVWSGYYTEAEEREQYLAPKKELIQRWVENLNPLSAIDAGANEGQFSQLLSAMGIYTVSADFDHYSVNRLYNVVKKNALQNLHPLLLDLTHPSPPIGVNNEERDSFTGRTSQDLVLALALIHHLAVGKNIPFDRLAKLFRSLGRTLILEFVPREDEKLQLMLSQKRDVYNWYTEENFLRHFSRYYRIVDQQPVGDSCRTLYLLQPHEN